MAILPFNYGNGSKVVISYKHDMLYHMLVNYRDKVVKVIYQFGCRKSSYTVMERNMLEKIEI